ncbi:hypothetical protein [Streptomyces sp. NBC_01591]|nr:hypothetical protein [Streptomyces sp. NBC_01591]
MDASLGADVPRTQLRGIHLKGGSDRFEHIVARPPCTTTDRMVA